ncbi:MAG: FAD-dependent oxidoreductase [Clostridiales bacterium]|nr:FAD-dependent oxidoreductase [Clostridiales bacterium]
MRYSMENGHIRADTRSIPVMDEYDVVVCGGGVAGVGAGLAAARAGLRTIILETYGALGGLATLGLVNIPLDFVSGLGREMIDELEKLDGHWHRNSDPEKHKLVLDRMMKKYGCDVLLVTPLIDTFVEGDTVRGVVVQTKTGPQVILGKRFIDASGDSDLVYFAGGAVECGRESDGISMACSLEFMLGGVDWEAYINSDLKQNDPQWIRLLAKCKEDGDPVTQIENHLNWMTHLPGRPQHCGKDEVSICIAHSRMCRPTDNRDLTRMYIEGREQADLFSRFIKKNIPGFEHSYLSQTAALLGVRESRRIVGEYRFTGEDIAYARKKPDVITISQHGFDVHGIETVGNQKWFRGRLPDGSEAYITNRGGYGSLAPPTDLPTVNMTELIPDGLYFYDIPYRSLIPTQLDGVLAAGRNISSNIFGQSGSRLILCCMSMGEAAGTAAALSLEHGVQPRALDVPTLQRTLIRQGLNIGQDYRDIGV